MPTKWGVLSILREYMSDTQILEELIRAMSDYEAIEQLLYIERMWGISEE